MDTQGSVEVEELDMDEELQATLEDIRKFWTRDKVITKRKAEFPSFRVPARREALEFYSCMDCHEDDKINDRRVRKLPACHEACLTGARVIGNINDPKSEIRHILETKTVFRLKEELNTEPKFWFYTD